MTYLNFREPFSAWSHGLWLLASLPVTIILWRRCGADRAKRFTFLIFGLCLAACGLGSTLYHAVRLDPGGIDFFERMDHVGIHLLIAGSYTPLAWNLLRGPWRWGTLTAVWTATLFGCVLLLANVRLPAPLRTCEYLAMGWGSLLCYFEMARVISHRAMRPLVIGGVLYSVGAVLNLVQWPVLWPGVFGAHEMFHLWVIAGSLSHFWFMLTAVVPFAYAAGAAAQTRTAPVWPTARRRPIPIRVSTARLPER